MDLNVSDAELADLLTRVRSTRWATPWPVDPWEAGTDQAELRRLADHWATRFDWRAHERRINSLPWASVDLDGITCRTCGSMPNAKAGCRCS